MTGEQQSLRGRGEIVPVIFRIGQSDSVGNSVSRKRDPLRHGLAEQLIEFGEARAVLERAPSSMAGDSILAGLYVVNRPRDVAGELVSELQAQGAELAYIAPEREVLNGGDQASGKNNQWRELIGLDKAMQLPQWVPKNRVVKLAIVDTGVDTNHPQLKKIHFEDHLGVRSAHTDVSGHGTHVVGLIGAQRCSGNGFYGIAAECTDVTMHRGIGRFPDGARDVAGYYRSLRGAGSNQILNLSLGGEGEDPTETRLVKGALAGGVMIVAAMGNSGPGGAVHYPAAIPEVIGVGAVDGTGASAGFSSDGAHLTLVAPGIDILSTVPTYGVPITNGSGYPPLALLSGTSMAAPIVTGVIARMLAYKPSLTRMQLFDLIKSVMASGWTKTHGYGTVDACALLSAL